MNNITTNRILIGVAIVGLLFILYKSRKNNVQQGEKKKIEPKINLDPPQTEEEAKTKSVSVDEDITKGVPAECLNGFELDGFNYEIKNNKFIKTKI